MPRIKGRKTRGPCLILKHCRPEMSEITEANHENRIAALVIRVPGTSRIRNRNISQYSPTLEHSRGEKTQQRPRVDFKKQLTIFCVLGLVFLISESSFGGCR